MIETTVDGGWLVIRKELAEAYGKQTSGSEFLVRAGSTAMREGSPKVKRNREERDRLVQQGVLVPDANSELFRFSRDHLFSSMSTAAGVVIDGNSNGSHWKALTGRLPRDSSDLSLDRRHIEAAMDAYDRYLLNGSNGEVFDDFGAPKTFWVRSSREREIRVYPTKPLVAFILNQTKLNGGWGEKSDAAARLHNAGYIIVDQNDQPIERPERYDHLMEGADRIRLCALNYFIEPARERAASEVSISVRDFALALGLENDFPNICQALGGPKFQKLADVPPPTSTEPNPSSTTVFTFNLNSYPKAETVTNSEPALSMPPENLILYGPPGTGKTYRTALEAVRICLGQAVADELSAPDCRAELMQRYRELVSNGRIDFVTFHQSMSYEEFVEGLRPSTGEEADTSADTGFRLEPVSGVFKRISERAEKGSPTSQQAHDISLEGRQVFKMSVGRANVAAEEYLFEEAISEGHTLLGWEDIDFSDDRFSDIEEILEACRTQGELEGEATLQSGQVSRLDVFRNQLEIGDIIVVTKGNRLFRAIGEVTGEYQYRQRHNRQYCHRRSVRWLWVDREGVPVSEIYDSNFTMKSIYPLDRGRLDTIALESYMNSGGEPVHREARPHVLIIDEINRANISKVFGELITLLEPDKRLGAENEIRLTLPYSKKKFGVPSNLHIIGTMNTADRSIALLDTALRRRFAFKELMPDPSVLSDNVEGINLRKLLRTLNERIEYLFDREHQIGHAYFTGCTSHGDVEAVMRDRVIPLLAEYFYEDWAKVAAVLGDSASGASRFLEARTITPPSGLAVDEFSEGKWRWIVKDQFDFSEFEA